MVARRILAILLSTFVLLVCASDRVGAVEVGSDLTTTIDVAASGEYQFGLLSDGGGRLSIDDGVVIDDLAAHAAGTVTAAIFLTAGIHTLSVHLAECCGGTPGVELILPDGVTMADPVAVPEPHTLLLIGAGMTGLAIFAGRRRRASA